MRKFLTLFVATLALSSCGNEHNPLAERLSRYDLVTLKIPESGDLIDGMSDNGKEVLNLYRFAADYADSIYWRQVFGDKGVMLALPDPVQREYALVNYGPWDRTTGAAFVDGYGQRPEGLGFYPADMTDEEWEAFADTAKYSPYTLIRRGEDGSLECVWYHEAYADCIAKIGNCLAAAADITVMPSVRSYLLAKAEALATDSYAAADSAWLDVADSRMDLIIGPYETNDDLRYGIKASYGAFVLLKDMEETGRLKKFADRIGSGDIFSCNAIYYAGNANAGIKVAAVNLPYDTPTGRRRTFLMKNIINEKFLKVISPIGTVLLRDDDQRHVSSEAFYWNIAFREMAHGASLSLTKDGVPVAEALGGKALTIEEAKVAILGAKYTCQMASGHEVGWTLSPEDALATCLVSLIRSARFGNAEALGKGNILCYNYLRDKGAFTRTPSGVYDIDYGKMEEGIGELSDMLASIQEAGDKSKAEELIDAYCGIGQDLIDDFMYIHLEGIPMDLRFKFER